MAFVDDAKIPAASMNGIGAGFAVQEEWGAEGGVNFPKEKRGWAEVAPWQPAIANPPRQIRAGQVDISETDTLEFVAFRLDRGLTLRPQLTQVCKRLHASFEEACGKALAEGEPTAIVRGLFEGVVLNTFRQEAWSLVMAEGRYKALGFCLRHMGTRLLGASENIKGKKNLPSPWLAAELGWVRLTTIVDEEALVFRGALDLPTAPELVKKVAKAAAALRKKGIRQACDPKAPGVRTFEAATTELQEKLGIKGIREVFANRSVVALEQQRRILRAYRQHVRGKLMRREMRWWRDSTTKLDAQLELPYAKTKPLPAPFDGFCGHK